MPLFDDLISQYGPPAGASDQAPASDPGASPATPPAPPPSLFGDLIAKYQNGAPEADGGPIAGLKSAVTGMGNSVIDSLLAGAQHTTPIVTQEKGGYQIAPQHEQDFFGETGFPRDQTKQVVLRNPDSGKLAIYNRGTTTEEGALPAMGRVLGIGALAPTSLAGPTLAGPVVNAIANRIGSPENKALTRVGRAISQDAAAGGPSASDIMQSLSQAGDTPLTIADVGGENVRGLAGQVARMPGPGRQQATQFLNDRDALAGGRLADAVSAGIGDGEGGNYTVAQQLIQQRAQRAAPLYERAYQAAPIPPDTLAPGGALSSLMTRPSMQQATNRALSIAKEEGRDPTALGLTLNEAGDPVFQSVPSWQTLDYLKRGLDDVLNGFRDSTTGRLNLDEGGRAINQTRKDFLGLLDEHNPDLAAARNAFSGPSQSIGALKQGAGLLTKAPDEIAAEVARLSPGDRQFYKLGAANALKAQIARTSSGGNEARVLISNVFRQKQLAPLFDSPAAFSRFIDRATAENTMFSTRQAVLGGSQTAARLAQDAEGGGGFIGPAGEAATALITHEPILAARAVGRMARNAYGKLSGMSPEVAEQAGNVLFQPGAGADVVQNALGRAAPGSAQVRPMLPRAAMAIQQEPAPAITAPSDLAADAVSKLGPGEPVTRRMLMEASGSRSMDQVVATRSELVRRGLISVENGRYLRARTINQPEAVAPIATAPIPPPIPPAPQLPAMPPGQPAPPQPVLQMPHPLRDQAYGAAKDIAPTLRSRTFDDLIDQTNTRPAPVFPAPDTHVLDQLGSGHANYATVHLMKRAGLIPDWRPLLSKAEGWADQLGVPKGIDESMRREEGIARAYNAFQLGQMQQPPGIRRIFRSIGDYAGKSAVAA